MIRDKQAKQRIKIKGRYARPINRLSTSIGTRSEIFQFNEFSRARSLINPVNPGGGASQPQENPAGNSSSFGFTPATILRKAL